MSTLSALTATQLSRIIQLAQACEAEPPMQAATGTGLAEHPAGFSAPAASDANLDGKQAELRAAIDQLGPEARAELVAVAQLGRDGLPASRFAELRDELASMEDDEAADALAAGPISQDLRSGVERLGIILS